MTNGEKLSTSLSDDVDCIAHARPQNGSRPILAACFAEGTPQEYIEQIQSMAPTMNSVSWLPGDGPAPHYELDTSWPGPQGQPITLTWSLIPDGVTIPDGNGEGSAPNELFSRMDSLFSAQGGRAAWIARVQSCFERWHQLTGITYTRVMFNGNDWDDGASWGSSASAGLRGDIRISMKPLDGASGLLGYNYYPNHGDMVLDRSENWASSTNNNRFFRNVFMHEHGHGIGLDHVCPINGAILMEPFLTTSFDGPRQDDIRGGQRGYGDPYEENDAAAVATDLGVITPAAPLTTTCTPPNPPSGTSDPLCSTCSIDGASDVDFYKFTVGASSSASVTVTPVGSTYQDNPQNSNCTGTETTNALAIADLNVQLLGTNGSTVLATGASAGAGNPETVSNVSLGSAGTYYIRIYLGNSPGETQLYRMSISVNSAAQGCATCAGDLTGDNITDGKDMAAFVNCYLSSGGSGCACADFNGDTAINGTDVALFTTRLTSATVTCP